MKYLNNNIFYSIVSFSIIFAGYFYLYLFKENTKLIKFSPSGISIDFEVEISNNIKDVEKFLINYEFIESYLVTLNNKDLNVDINLKEPFAKNNLNQEVIFEDGSIGSFSYFNNEYIENIELIDTSEETLQINDYLNKSIDHLSSIFKINQIKLIDSRRYDIYLEDNLRIMMPKIIDQKLLLFLEDNYELLKQNSNFKDYLDLRNFHEKTIRAK
jgi:ribosomal protein S8